MSDDLNANAQSLYDKLINRICDAVPNSYDKEMIIYNLDDLVEELLNGR